MKLHHNTKNTKKAQRSNLHPTRHTTATHLRVATKAWLAVVCLTGVLIVRFPAQLSAATIEVSVALGDPVFKPANVSIQPGDTVKWTWGTPGHPHTVTSGVDKPNGLFDSGLHQSPFTFSYTFNSPGTFDYYCETHLAVNMVGQVIVGGGAPTPTPTPAPTAAPSIYLGNIATRLKVEAGDNTLIGGFIVSGPAGSSKKVLIRGLGPTLAKFGVPGVLADPFLELRDGLGALITSNNNWQQGDITQIPESFKTGIDPLESIIVRTLTVGSSGSTGFTAILKGANSETGVALAEVYDVDTTSLATLGNISTRGFVQKDDNVMIGGFIVSGSGQQKLVIRALGPTLGSFGISNPLADPLLELHDGNGATLQTNDNWQDSQAAEIQASGFAPVNASESVILRTLAPGSYTAIVRGVGNTVGVALVEVYTLP